MKKWIIITLTVIWVIVALVVGLMWTIAIGVNTWMTNETSSEVDRSVEETEQMSIESELEELLNEESSETVNSGSTETWVIEIVTNNDLVLTGSNVPDTEEAINLENELNSLTN